MLALGAFALQVYDGWSQELPAAGALPTDKVSALSFLTQRGWELLTLRIRTLGRLFAPRLLRRRLRARRARIDLTHTALFARVGPRSLALGRRATAGLFSSRFLRQLLCDRR